MAWSGYFTYNGVEIINASRTEAYLEHAPWFRPVYKSEDLGPLLGETYSTPLFDEAPWIDPIRPESHEFYGFYPTSVSGLEDSTRYTTPFEGTGDGGYPGDLIHRMRTGVFTGVLIAASEAGAEYGMSWLRRALLHRDCSTSTQGGADLCFLSSIPKFRPIPDPANSDLHDQHRRLRQVVINQGPTILRKRQIEGECGASVWEVTFNALAGDPAVYSLEREIVEGFLDPEVQHPWAPGVIGKVYETVPVLRADPECPSTTYEPLMDPLCPAIAAPPAAPIVALACYERPEMWERRMFSIDENYVPTWSDVVPIVRLHSGEFDLRAIRIRFYTDIMGTGDPDDDACSYCGDMVVSYMPANSTLVLDGVSKLPYLEVGGAPLRRADSVVHDSNGNPIDWPTLSCGSDFIVTVDVPLGADVPSVDVALVGKEL